MIALGCDHGGYGLMQEVIRHLEDRGLEYKNYGCYSEESVDYPVYAKAAANAVAAGECLLIEKLPAQSPAFPTSIPATH